MNKETKVKRFVKFLKNILAEIDSEFEDDIFEDHEILEIFRKCSDCDTEIVTPVQQMHAILEFDSPQRAFESLTEIVIKNQEKEKSCEDELEEDFECVDCGEDFRHCDCEPICDQLDNEFEEEKQNMENDSGLNWIN